MSPKLKVVVAGAGVLGLTCAVSLARAGARVVLTDPAAPGENASGVAAGMLAPVMEALLDPLSRPHLDLLLAARDLWPALAAQIGVTLDRSGALAVGEAARVAREEGARIGALVRPVEAHEVAELAPGVVAQPGLFTAEDWRIDPLPAMAALASAAADSGVELRRAPLAADEACDFQVLAVGAEPNPLAPELAHLTPIKGHILRAPGVAYRGCVVRGERAYLTPGPDGLVIGASMEIGVRGLTLDEAQVTRLRAAGEQLLPAMAGGEVVARTGVRASTPDGLPLVGRSRSGRALLATGARRNGWLLAPLVAGIVTAQVFGDDPGPFAARLCASRFDGRGDRY
ncbi:MAG: FAD-dependent oxidoreductase [Phenylobacterium sp.]